MADFQPRLRGEKTMTIKVRFILRCTDGLLGRELLASPPGSQFELDLQTLPKVGDVLHVHTDFLPPYYTAGGIEPKDVKINRDENAGDFKDTVTITVAGQPCDPKDCVVHIVRPELQVATVLFAVQRYPEHGLRDMKH